MRLALLGLVLLALAAGCGSDDNGNGNGGEPPVASGGCESVDAPGARDPGTREAPTEPLDASKTHALVVETNCGSFTITLDLDTAPNTSASLVALARDG